MDTKIITHSAKETQKIADDFAKVVQDSAVLCLYGDLGAGKTTFVQGFAKGLGINKRLISPTFIIVRQYDLESSIKNFYHIDLYRVQSKDDLKELGLKEILENKHNMVAIEWAEKLGPLLPKERWEVHCKLNEDMSHTFSFKHYERFYTKSN